jgi:two-component system, chemotaxis family, CheB/CheR fusion protein
MPARRIPPGEGLETVSNSDYDNALQQQLQALQQQYRSLLQTIKSAVLTLDGRDVITTCNDSALAIWGPAGVPLVGRRLQDSDLVHKCPELSGRLEASKSGPNDSLTFQCRIRSNDEERILSITIRPVISEANGIRTGTIINAEDTTTHERLQSTVEQLEATTEELQSANEELETTNEELQSTNEELETTNEELQSTNEELETTNEELQSLNEELENLNEELASRTRELDTLTTRYAETLKRMPWPVMLVDREGKIQLWNSAAQRVFGIGATSVVGVDLNRMPLELTLRKALVRRCRGVMQQKKASTIHNLTYEAVGAAGTFDVRFTPIAREDNAVDGVMIMFGPIRSAHGPETNGQVAPKKREAVTKRSKSKDGTRSRS